MIREILENLKSEAIWYNSRPNLDNFKKLAYSNDDNSATVLKLTVQGSHNWQATELPVLATLVLSGLS